MQHIITVIRLLFLGLFIFLLAKEVMLWFALFAVSLSCFNFCGIYCSYTALNTLMIQTEWLAKKLQTTAPKW